MPTLALKQYQLKDLLHDGRLPMRMGCFPCRNLDVCGGVNVAAEGLFSCHDLCAGEDPSRCTRDCPRQVWSYTRYIQEVGGFSLDSVPRAATVVVARLPRVVPLV